LSLRLSDATVIPRLVTLQAYPSNVRYTHTIAMLAALHTDSLDRSFHFIFLNLTA
jgi:hypothetical protein